MTKITNNKQKQQGQKQKQQTKRITESHRQKAKKQKATNYTQKQQIVYGNQQTACKSSEITAPNNKRLANASHRKQQAPTEAEINMPKEKQQTKA